MIVGYDLGGGGRRPLDGEHLRVEDDGAFELWRTEESPIVGRFAGRLEPDRRVELAALADAAAAVGPGDPTLPPGSRGEAWLARDTPSVIPAGRTPSGAWGALVATVRPLLVELTRDPVAAIELDVHPDGRAATLRHRGPEALDLDPASLALEVAAWKGYYDLVGTWTSPHLDLGPAAEGTGWTREIPLDHGFPTGRGRVLHVKVQLDVRVEGGLARLRPTVAPPMDEA